MGSSSPSSFLTPSPFFPRCLRVGFLCGFVCRMQPLLEAIRAGFPHYLPVITETRQLYGNAGPSHRAERKERRAFTIKHNGARAHAPTRIQIHAYALHLRGIISTFERCLHYANTILHLVPEHKRLRPPCPSVNAFREDGLASRSSLSLSPRLRGISSLFI